MGIKIRNQTNSQKFPPLKPLPVCLKRIIRSLGFGHLPLSPLPFAKNGKRNLKIF